MPLTLQSVDCPCLKLLESNFGCGWQHIEVQPVLVVLLLEFRFGKLSLLVIEIGTTLGIDSGMVVADHGEVVLLLVYYPGKQVG